MFVLRCFPLLLICLLLLSCAAPMDQGSRGIGGSGKYISGQPGTGGIGGTGMYAKPGQGGLGGTGKAIYAGKRKRSGGLGGTGLVNDHMDGGLGGTGIVGTITGFGSIWVNDAHIHFNDDTPIRINNKLADKNSLRLGQVVAVLSDRVQSDYQAQTIDVIHELIGPITISDDLQTLMVLGQVLELNSTALIFDESNQKALTIDELKYITKFRSGLAKVSGYRGASGVISVSRIDVVRLAESSQGVPFQILGLLKEDDSGVMVADLSLNVSPLLLPEDLSHRYLISGFIDPEEGMVVEDIGVDSAQRVIELASSFIIQGLADLDDFEDSIEFVGMDLDLNEGLSLDIVSDLDLDEELIQIVGGFDGENILIEDFGYYAEHLEEYVELLHDVVEEHFEGDLDVFELEGEFEGHEFDDVGGDDDIFEDEDFEFDEEFEDAFEWDEEFEYEEYEDEELEHEEFEHEELEEF